MSQTFPHGYALLIGVGESVYPKWSLPITVKDAKALKSVLTDSNFCAYPNDEHNLRLLHDTAATRRAILDGLEWLKVQAANDSEATVVVFYSGHGWLDQSTGQYYLIQHDVEPFDIPNTALCAQDFTELLRQIKAKRLLVVIDSCHAEGMATAKDGSSAIKLPSGLLQTALPKSLVDNLKQGEGRAVFTSSRGQQLSWIRADRAMSIYTYHFIEALQGANNQPGDTTVRVSNLMNHLGKSVPESARTMHKVEQTPYFDTATEDFPIALLLGGKGLSPDAPTTLQDEASQTPNHGINATGAHSVAAGQDINHSPIISGDRNVVQQGENNVNIRKARDVSWGKTPE
jgi:uncharacterized caspase-like protein